MAKTYAQFKQERLNKGVDYDGYYGYQCWDLVAYYLKWLGYEAVNTTPVSQGGTGYAQDIYNFRKTNGILNYCTAIKKANMQQGDIVVFKKTSLTPSSHIAIADSKVDNNYWYFLGQNQGGTNGVANLIKLPLNGIYAYVFRPKCFKQTNTLDVWNYVPKGFKKASGYFKAKTTLKIFLAPTSNAKSSGKVYNNGDVVYIDGYYDNDGYRWVSWLSTTAPHQRHWLKRGTVKEGKLDKSYGKLTITSAK